MTFAKPKRIAIAWEDRYWEPLHEVILRRRAPNRPAGSTENIDFLPYPVFGNGNFTSFVADDWPIAHAKGFPRAPGAIDHVICVADADAIHSRVPGMQPPPSLPSAVGAWLARAEPQFQTHLREKAHKPTTVHGLLMRWAKESLTLAAYDRSQATDKLGLQLPHPNVQKHLSRCTPVPGSVPDAAFTDTFRKPVECIDRLLTAQGLPPIGKGSFMDDVIRALSGADLSVVCARVPDIDRILRLAWSLATTQPPAPATLTPSRKPPSPKRKSK